jgi:Flp pilus assembly protein CpaB
VLTITAPEVTTNGDRPARSRGASPKRRRTYRSVTERLTLNVVVGLVAALLAFVLTGVLLADRRETLTVAVAKDRVPAGAEITPDMVSGDEVPASTGFAENLVPLERISDGALVAARTLQPGEPLTKAVVGSPGSTAGQRVMSIPLESWQAANGEIQIGDQVDVIETTDDGTRYVLSGAAVVGRSSDESAGGLVGGVRRGDLVLSIEVNADEALALAAAIDSGTIVVVRSTGAPPAEPASAIGAESGG